MHIMSAGGKLATCKCRVAAVVTPELPKRPL